MKLIADIAAIIAAAERYSNKSVAKSDEKEYVPECMVRVNADIMAYSP